MLLYFLLAANIVHLGSLHVQVSVYIEYCICCIVLKVMMNNLSYLRIQ